MNDVIAKHILSCYTHATQSIVFSSYEPWPIPIFVHSCMNDSDNYMQLFKKLNEKKNICWFSKLETPVEFTDARIWLKHLTYILNWNWMKLKYFMHLLECWRDLIENKKNPWSLIFQYTRLYIWIICLS